MCDDRLGKSMHGFSCAAHRRGPSAKLYFIFVMELKIPSEYLKGYC